MKKAWQEAMEWGEASALRAMLDAGEDVDSRDKYGQTALMNAAREGHTDAVRVLIEAGADLDRTAKHGLSALMLATVNGREGVVRMLLEAGADAALTGTGAPGFAGKTALDLAADLGRESIGALLRRRESR